MMMMGTTTNSNQHQNGFTAAQWEELEQQALIYKYMVSGVPVPTDLILSVRRSLFNPTFSSSSSLSNQPNLGVWEGSYEYVNQLYQQIGGVGGYGRKIDLEPGRCRRTDGKKWRCSKEAYPDSKYCEKHMHRGRNRSRKPVESPIISSSSSTKSIDTTHPPLTSSVHNNFVDSSPYSHKTLKDYRYMQGMKDLWDEDERSTYFQLNNHHLHNNSHFNFQNLKDHQQKDEETQGQHCFVMGTDFIKSSSEETTKSNINQKDTKLDHETTTSKQQQQQPFHHFFSPPKTTPNPNVDPAWVEVDQHNYLINPPKSPLSTQDLFQSKPRPYW